MQRGPYRSKDDDQRGSYRPENQLKPKAAERTEQYIAKTTRTVGSTADEGCSAPMAGVPWSEGSTEAEGWGATRVVEAEC